MSEDFFKSFDWAVVRLATYLAGSDPKARLLFGSVSLLTNERPRPLGSPGVDQFRIATGQKGRVFFRRTVLTAADAVAWYRATDPFLTPVPSDPAERSAKLDGIAISSGAFFDDPAWPALGIPAEADLLSSPGGPGDPAPFIGTGSAPARIHRRFGDNRGFEAVTGDATAVAFLKRRLHVDLADYTEYLGSLALIVPNPIVRGIGHYIAPTTPDGPENLVFRLVPRPGQTLDRLSFTVIERRANLLSRFQTMAVPRDGLIVIKEQLPIEQSGYVLTHPDHGVLVHQPTLSFIRSVNISMGLVRRMVKVEAPKTDSRSSPSAGYIVHEVAHEIPIGAGEDAPKPDLARVFEGEARRERRAQARRYDQTWFGEGDRDAAIAFIRARIGRARESVLIADPYFGMWDQMRFLHAVHRTDVELTILTSRLAFESETLEENGKMRQASRPISTKVSSEAARLEAFAHALETFTKRGIKNVSAYVLLGRTPPLHDRFLVIDGAIWFLGHSLNALGSRASMIMQVPDPEPVTIHLAEIKAQAIPFEQYRTQRGKPPRRQRKSKKP
jgi:hypothetical protein